MTKFCSGWWCEVVVVVEEGEDAAFMITLFFLFDDDDATDEEEEAAAAADAAVLKLNCCCMVETIRFLKANDDEDEDEEVINADGGILIRDVFVATIGGDEVADAVVIGLMRMIKQLRPARIKDDDDDRMLPEALGLDFLFGTSLICIDFRIDVRLCR